MVWFDKENRVRHGVKYRYPVIGGGDTITTWCGSAMYLDKGLRSVKRPVNCLACIARMEPDA